MAGLLNHTPADIMSWLLVGLGVGGDSTKSPLPSWPVYSGVEPNSPDNCITVKGTTDVDDMRTFEGERQLHYGVQIRIRSTTEKIGYARALLIATTLDTVAGVGVVTPTPNVNTYWITVVNVKNGVLQLGIDNPSTKRYLFTINCLFPMRKTA